MFKEEKEMLEEVFEGDVDALNDYYRALTKDTFCWDDIALSAKVYPELEDVTKNLIEKRLGYLPHSNSTITFEPILRSLYHQYRIGQLNEKDFFQQVDELIKLIQNRDAD